MLLKEKLKGKKLILASKSPRRRDILCACGLEFSPGIDFELEERYPDDLTPTEIPLYLARLKSVSYPVKLECDEILITADTVVVLGDSVLGKPRDRSDAISMLQRMSGEKHTVVTGVVIRDSQNEKYFNVKTDVWFRKLRDEEIVYYVDNFDPYDKAGAYGIQDWIGYVGIGRIEGSFYNVMGLPMQSLYVNLEKFLDDNLK